MPNLLSQPLQESSARQLVLWFTSRHWTRLMCLKQLLVYVPETAAGFEGVFPNCTGTLCCRKQQPQLAGLMQSGVIYKN